MENILVIGNGFDIAHGFNTRYEDFINFCKTIATVYQGFKDNQFIYQNEYNELYLFLFYTFLCTYQYN